MTKKEKFYKTALELIHEKGFKEMTIRDLGVALSCDSANIYNYTKSKLGILETLLFETSTYFHEGINYILSSDLSPIEQIGEIIRLHVDLSYQEPLKASLLINEWRNIKEPKLTEIINERDKYELMVGEVVQRGVETGVFRKLNIQIATKSILGSLRWQHDYYLNTNKDANPLNVIQELKLLIIPGLLK